MKVKRDDQAWKNEKETLLRTIEIQHEQAKKLENRFRVLQAAFIEQQSVLDLYQIAIRDHKKLLEKSGEELPLQKMRLDADKHPQLENAQETKGPLSPSYSPPALVPKPSIVSEDVADVTKQIKKRRLPIATKKETECNLPSCPSIPTPIQHTKKGERQATTLKQHSPGSIMQWINCRKKPSGKKTMVPDDNNKVQCATIPHPHVSEKISEDIKVIDLSATKEPSYRYVEVVRDRNARQKLPGHDCHDCSKYFDAIEKMGLQSNNTGCGRCTGTQKMKYSRHRAKFEPYQTPDDFWCLSFPDSEK